MGRFDFDSSVGTNSIRYYINGGLSIVLVLLGGLFAGLTLAYVKGRLDFKG